MILFVAGQEEPGTIYDTLDHIEEEIGITEVCGNAFNPSMIYVNQWCEKHGVPINLYLAKSANVIDIIKTNSEIIEKERPQILLSFQSKNEDELHYLIEDANSDYSSIDYVITRNKNDMD